MNLKHVISNFSSSEFILLLFVTQHITMKFLPNIRLIKIKICLLKDESVRSQAVFSLLLFYLPVPSNDQVLSSSFE